MTRSLVVRSEKPEDGVAIDEVLVDAFRPGGSAVVGLVERIRASDAYVPDLALVAEDDDGVIGFTMLSWVGLRGSSRDRILDLTPVAVRTGRQRQGVGTALIRTALARAEAMGEPGVMVEGVPDYYPRFGFERGSSLGFEAPSPRIPDEAFMVRRLSTYEPGVAGRVVYPPAFDAPGI